MEALEQITNNKDRPNLVTKNEKKGNLILTSVVF